MEKADEEQVKRLIEYALSEERLKAAIKRMKYTEEMTKRLSRWILIYLISGTLGSVIGNLLVR